MPLRESLYQEIGTYICEKGNHKLERFHKDGPLRALDRIEDSAPERVSLSIMLILRSWGRVGEGGGKASSNT